MSPTCASVSFGGCPDERFPDEEPLRRGGYAYHMVIQHEHQHNETMLQAFQIREDLVHPLAELWRPARVEGRAAAVTIDAGEFTMGTDDVGWAYDNEQPAHVRVVGAYAIDSHPVTNGEYARFVAEGAEPPMYWRRAPDRVVAREVRAGRAAAGRRARAAHLVPRGRGVRALGGSAAADRGRVGAGGSAPLACRPGVGVDDLQLRAVPRVPGVPVRRLLGGLLRHRPVPRASRRLVGHRTARSAGTRSGTGICPSGVRSSPGCGSHTTCKGMARDGMSAAELAGLVHHRQASAAEIVAAAVGRAERADARLNAVAVPLYEKALAAAGALDAAEARGLPLAGVPVSVKESFEIAGTAASGGVLALADDRSRRDAAVVAALRAAGAVVVAKGNLAQLLWFAETDNPVLRPHQQPLGARSYAGRLERRRRGARGRRRGAARDRLPTSAAASESPPTAAASRR